MIKNIYKSIILLGILCFSNIAIKADQDTEELNQYVQSVVDQGYNIVLDKTLTPEQRTQKSAIVIKDHLNLDWMAKYTLGRYRKNLPDEKLQAFIKIYSSYVVKAYADLSKNYNGQKLAFLGTKELDDNIFLVSTKIIQSNSNDYLKVDYLVHKITDNNNNKNKYLVGDIITEGVSVLNSQQSEFSNILANGGIDMLINQLQQKITAKR
jgi:phospholipid transport system substrate-binding protein